MTEIDRRRFLGSASACAMNLYLAGLAKAAGNEPLTKRSVINTNFLSIFDYQFINHFLNADQFGPVGTAWATGPVWNKGILDESGCPRSGIADNRPWGCGIRVPASSDFSGPYVLIWEGDGQIAFRAGTWVVDSRASMRYSEIGKGVWKGSSPRVVLHYSGPRLLVPVQVIRTGASVGTNFCRNLQFYRLEDERDLLAGKVFRRPYKRILADLHP
jgi:hypothetical protein